MVKIPKKLRWAARLLMAVLILPLAFATSLFAQGNRYKSGSEWSFGIMGDTQWTVDSDPEGDNPNYVSAAVARALEQQFINHGVKFVIEPGDLSDRAGAGGVTSRAAAAQPLFDAGIGFFPLRGNHEEYGYLYGLDPNHDLNVSDFKSAFPQTQGQGSYLFGATNFSSPLGISTNDVLKGLSYSFDYNNARFVAVDVEQTAVKRTIAPNNPASCVTAVTPGTPANITPYCGQGYYYILSDDANYNTTFVVYQATYDISNGYTVLYDAYANTGATVNITIPAGTWFRIASNGRPSTNFYAWDMQNPLETYNGQPFDLYDPVGLPQNRVLEIDSSTGTEYFPGKQQTWISAQLNKNTRGTDHAFVLSHRAMMGENHVDCFFGTDPSLTPADQNAFYASLANNGVKLMISAHDHMQNRALLSSPDGLSQVTQQITIGASSKFYTPSALSGFPTGVKARETEISQEVKNIGYYIYTIDGPRVTVDYYSDATGGFMDDADYPYGDASVPARLYMPQFHFVKKETWGYSNNGQQFMIAQGSSYTGVQDSFSGTTANILAGANTSTTTDDQPDTPRPLTKAVNTGWVAKGSNPMLASNIFSLWGMTELGHSSSDVYVLQMSYSATSGLPAAGYRLATLNSAGNWANAVDLNVGPQTKTFVRGPYASGCALGTYGIDEGNKTVWAVVNYDADFAANDIQMQTQASSYVYNRTTQLYTGSLIVTNTSGETITQVAISFTNLTANVTLTNASGTLNGSPYILKSIATGLKPGASVSIPLSFKVTPNANVNINFTPVTYIY